VVVLAFAAWAGAVAGAAAATAPDVAVQRACIAAVDAVQRVVDHAATAQAHTVTIHFQAVTPGTLTGDIGFNPTGSTIHVAADSTQAGGCATASIGPGVPKGDGRTRIVARLQRTFTEAGHYTVTFKLNKTGERILARLGAEDRAYRKRHPHGFRAPSMAFGVALSYAAAG